VGSNPKAVNVPNNVQDKVIFTGFLERGEYLKLLRPDHCFLALSSGEELDYSCIEAMARGCSVIASDIPAHYMVKDGVTGKVVERTCESVSSAMLEFTEEDLRRKIGTNASREARKLTCPEDIARKYVAIYENVLSR
jgi:glycosyltransferase involved in cell wall biosynthesis